MTTITNTTANKINFRLIALFVLLVLSSTGAFAQNNTTAVSTATATTQVSIAKETTMVITTDNTVASNNDFAVWFTGNTKTEGSATTNSSNFGKKQLINSGVKSASVLVRTILKKVIFQENSVA
ncbi:hypothetical protein [Flavobacterium sp. XGLA_31]|uniref:hypothetical protein n=1 Tax=Flavobacterium sp. XGLA_31 TaxID=3447666 RepID=UPI003F2C8454